MIRVHKGLFVSIIAAATTVSSAPAAFGSSVAAFVEIKGQKQGQFRGESLQSSRAAKWMDVLSFKESVSVPVDSASGQATGRRKHDQVCFTKHWGAASPQIFNAVVTNEVLPEVQFEFTKPEANGQGNPFETVKLVNAVITQDRQQLGVEGEAPGHTTEYFEEVCFTYQKIEITNGDAHTTSQDSWM